VTRTSSVVGNVAASTSASFGFAQGIRRTIALLLRCLRSADGAIHLDQWWLA
jgi:hypothetical protein